MEFLAKNEEETAKLAHDFAIKLGPNDESAQVVGLYGELGAGKTTFMKYLAKSLGVKETIQSPTFVIMKKYELKSASKKAQVKDTFKLAPFYFQTLIHIDAYRIENDNEMINLGWEEIINDPKNLVFVEWPERIAGVMPKHTKISFNHINENERNIKIES